MIRRLVWTWSTLALGVSFLDVRVKKLFFIGSGLFYLTLAIIGLTLTIPRSESVASWTDDIAHRGPWVHRVLGISFLRLGFVTE